MKKSILLVHDHHNLLKNWSSLSELPNFINKSCIINNWHLQGVKLQLSDVAILNLDSKHVGKLQHLNYLITEL